MLLIYLSIELIIYHIYFNSVVGFNLLTFIFIAIISILLWFLPKWGSVLFSVVTLVFIIKVIASLDIKMEDIQIDYATLPFIIILTVGILPFILFTKEARKEWAMK